ncbi:MULTISPECIES: DUF721 domain-containing protein [Marinobacter]|uniref:DciA family protein n=1 Tax=Marinobacter suaedae TaxID=3057675 RepID=A0ABT8W4D3_9GAMM|nr:MULTISPECIES: DciA family protein [unclassified Marinobacter]MBZ2167170.1 DUF721 domain-containing protein [Marinobacter sp. F4216]MDO3723090.1 DciA family protein [Marinobacter sp. chi1]
MSRKNAQKTGIDSLSGAPGLNELLKKAELHRQAESQVLEAIPPELAQGTRFVSCHEGELILSAENASKASRIRFRQHEIMEKVRANELFQYVWKLKVKVAPPRFSERPAHKKEPLSKENARLLKEEAGHTKDKKLREVLEKLASHVRD